MASVISSEFIKPHEFNVIINRYSSGDLVIKDTKKNTMFTLSSCDTNFHMQRLLHDGFGRSIAMLRGKNMTAHHRWNVFRGKSKADLDMIFSAATNDMIQYGHTHVNVSVANKTYSSNGCDFEIKGSWLDGNCTIYNGDSSTVIAQMHKLQTEELMDKFTVTIYPNVDMAFVVTLIAIVDAIKSTPSKWKVVGDVATGVAVVAQIALPFLFI